MPGLSPADIFAALRRSKAPEPNRDQNWKTCKAWAVAWGVSAQTAWRELRDGRDRGEIEVKELINGATGKPAPHYRYTGKAK